MPDHLFTWLSGALAGCLITIAVAIASRLQLLPDVIDLTLIPTGAGLGGLLFAAYGALRRYPAERLGRVMLFGNLLGAFAMALVLALALLIDVLS
jgi:Ca2+/Na+ antiporter